ncbi:unnamed protein product [Allacma fusca]|uniref:Nidogen n=1 Tax=Allacma fusca TaxID=39272 RepID=A0A8J2MHC7_9HEXA|nr:unnamed protein product [Allacma fusca]
MRELRRQLLFFVCAALFQFHQTLALARPTLYPFGPAESDASLPRDTDDVASPEFRLSTPIVFYGQQYNSIYVNQNGLVSFLTDIPTFVNIQFPLDYPTIAPLYSDVDTRIEGSIYYRETQAPELLERTRVILTGQFSSAANFQPSSLTIVTWDNVGYFDRKSDKLNTFQLVIASDGGDSYALFYYKKIQWIQGTGKNPSLQDAKAQAGLISGNGPHHFTLKGSGTDQVSSLHKRSNFGEDGVWAFHIGKVEDNIEEPDINIELDSSSEISSSCSVGATNCHSQAECIDYEPGFCCACGQGYYGNGRTCLQDGIPQRVTGKVKGVLNGIGIDDSDLFSYVLPGDGRAYTAISKIPEKLGYDLQTVSLIGTIIGWLFSTSVKGAPNGFQFTGGVFNYTGEVSFYQTGQKVTIHQNYMGLDVFSHLRVDTRLHGATPVVPVGKSIEMNDYEMQFTRVSPGILRSRSSHAYIIEGTSQENTFNIEQTIEYTECPWASPVPPELDTIKMKVARNYIIYDKEHQIARYATSSKSTPPEGEDPCKENKDKCGPNSSCVVDGDNYRCICDLGYEERYNYEDENPSATAHCVDIDECQIGTSTCDVTAICINSPGSHQCQCQPGYSGDGYTCTKILSCADVQCGSNAECVELSVGEPECRCLSGFYGDGLFCYQQTDTGAEISPGVPPDCRQATLCDPFADCIFSRSSNSYICNCRPGYTGDGIVCLRDTSESCDLENNCHPEADCRLDELLNEYTCVCRSGFIGDGYTCTRSREIGSLAPSAPAPTPTCLLNYCWCPSGYIHEDIRNECVPDEASPVPPDATCEASPYICDPNAACVYINDGYSCICKTGFSGDGRQCTPQDLCSSHSECSQYGECAYDQNELRYSCRCREGFEGDGKECKPKGNVGCDVLRNCDVNAQCVWDANVARYECECKPGYRGDGLTCQEDLMGCNALQNCDSNAECQYDPVAKGYRCLCREGYEGDGYSCRSAVPCYQDRSICDANAECLPVQGGREWKCQCSEGWQGNGFECQKEEKRDGSAVYVTKGMSLIRVPLNGDKSEPVVVEPFQTAIGVAMDCPQKKIYWGDVGGRAIKQVSFNGTDKQAFLDDEIGSPEGVSVDSSSHNIYWTDSMKDTIEVANLDTKLRKTLVSTGLVNPRGIAVYPIRGRLFWTDWNRDYPKIESSGLDGKDREVLVGDGLALPNSLVVDIYYDQLCWADAGTHKIECIGVDGRNRKVHVMNVKYPFGLTLALDTFYWTDWNTKMIESASRSTGVSGPSINVPLGGTGKLYGIVLVPPTCPTGYSPCEFSPCGPSRLCLPSARGGFSCLCPDGADSDCQETL